MATTSGDYLLCLQSSVNRIIHLLEDECANTAAVEYALFRTDVLYQAILRFCDVLPQGDFILDCVREVRECLLECTCVSENEGGHVLHSDYRAVAERQFTVRRGRPRYEVTKEQLEFFVERRFSVSEMASLLNVSPRTVERRLNEFGLSLRNNYSDISDENLDNVVQEIKRNFPNTGYKRMKGFLSQRGYTVQQERIRESMRRVDPEGVLLRGLQMRVIDRRHYRVPGPQCLWHIDGNHKLIR